MDVEFTIVYSAHRAVQWILDPYPAAVSHIPGALTHSLLIPEQYEAEILSLRRQVEAAGGKVQQGSLLPNSSGVQMEGAAPRV